MSHQQLSKTKVSPKNSVFAVYIFVIYNPIMSHKAPLIDEENTLLCSSIFGRQSPPPSISDFIKTQTPAKRLVVYNFFLLIIFSMYSITSLQGEASRNSTLAVAQYVYCFHTYSTSVWQCRVDTRMEHSSLYSQGFFLLIIYIIRAISTESMY